MLALFGHDEYSLLGIAALLDVDKIPYRRVSKLEHSGGEPLLIAGADLTAAEIAAMERQPALVLNGGMLFARQVFGAAAPGLTNSACAIGLDQPVWSASTARLARSFGKTALRIPLAPRCDATAVARGTTLASCAASNGSGPRPAIMRLNSCLWSLVDLGAAFANLLTENYLPVPPDNTASSGLKTRLRRASEGAYYLAPHSVRRWLQGHYYSRLARRLDGREPRVSEYPIEATGWLLIELVRQLITLTAGALVRIERWPAPYCAAATLTHDLEPRRYAYTSGLNRLLDRTAGTGHPAALGLVAEASDQYLTEDAIGRLRGHDVFCHGLSHRGENVRGRAQVSVSVQAARTRIERQLGRSVVGYRSPRLDRSPDLAWALDHSDFQYDSSYPDVDRENIEHFGAGVRLNVPYRPLINDASGGFRPSRCLELPLTAPDCIQPLFAGDSIDSLRSAVATKAAFVRQTGGVYVALVHAGVFGDQDATRREQHLEFVCSQLQHGDVWLAGIGQIAEWWRRREALRISRRDGAIVVRNHGTQPIEGVQVVIERDGVSTTHALPPLAVGAEAIV